MFARTSTIALFAMLPLLAAATAVPRTTTPTTPASQCNTGNLQCCNSAQESSNLSGGLKILLGLLPVAISGLTGQVGGNEVDISWFSSATHDELVTCSPLSIIGVGGNSCSAQPVCCSNNTFNGVVAVGCTPVNINL